MQTMKELFDCLKMSVVWKNHTITGRFSLVTLIVTLFVFCMASMSFATPEYDASEVDSPPKLVRQMPVKYPKEAKKDGITGKVIVRCLIGVDGKAGKLEVVQSEPAGVFDESALSTLKHWQFRPGIKSGELVATWVKVPFKFE
jgi:protein TonB